MLQPIACRVSQFVTHVTVRDSYVTVRDSSQFVKELLVGIICYSLSHGEYQFSNLKTQSTI